MEYAIDQSILYKAERFVDEPEIIDEDLFSNPPPVAVAAKPTEAAVKPKKARAPKRGTLQATAAEVYDSMQGDRKAVIECLILNYNMTKAGATTYFYNAKKNAKGKQ